MRLESLPTVELPFGWLRLDEARVVSTCSPSFVERFGLDVSGMRLDHLMAEGDRHGHSDYLAKLNTYTGGYLDTFVTLAVESRSVLARIRMRQEKDLTWFVMVEPIEYHDPIRELLEAQANQRALIQSASEGIAFLDVKCRFVELNAHFLTMCELQSKAGVKLTEDSVYGRTFAEVAGDRFRPILQALDHPVERQRTFSGCIVLGAKTLHAKLNPVFLSRRFLGGYVVSVEDRTSEEENRKLNELSANLAAANSGLELAVQNRTVALQLVLDHTGEGILSVGLDGKLFPERSQAVKAWFGEPEPDVFVWDYLAGSDAELAKTFRLAFGQMIESFLPFRVAAEQAPKQVVRDKLVFSLEYRDVTHDSGLDRIVVLIRDATSQLEAEATEREAKDFHQLVAQLLNDQEGYRHAVEEVSRLMEEVSSTQDVAASRQMLHTIKGSCSVVGFRKVADFVHALESQLAEESRLPSESELQALETVWHQLLLSISDFLKTGAAGEIRLPARDYDGVTALLRRQCPHDEILQFVEQWTYEPTVRYLERLGHYAYRLAGRLGKAIEVRVIDHDVRVSRNQLKSFWPTLIHVVRNAVDHGCESEQDRRSLGKNARCLIILSSQIRDGGVEICVADDGRGIDWDAVRSKATRMGHRSETREDLIELLFADGFSTREEPTDTSGRGVGLSSVRAACQQLGGDITVETESQRGTRFVVRFPQLECTSDPTPVGWETADSNGVETTNHSVAR